MNDNNYRKQLGNDARQSMKKLKNSIIRKNWVKLILSLYRGKKLSSIKLYKRKIKMTQIEAKLILQNQLFLLKKRKPIYNRLSLEKLINFTII